MKVEDLSPPKGLPRVIKMNPAPKRKRNMEFAISIALEPNIHAKLKKESTKEVRSLRQQCMWIIKKHYERK